jgi:hypothetical protein
MTEDFLQYIWRYNLFVNEYIIDSDSISIIDVGQLNTDSGPDFFNSKIKIGDVIWVGNVEIHKKSSDWYLHKHEVDNSYNNVILHVVGEINKDVFDSYGRKIPQIEIKFDSALFKNYSNILNSKHKIKCENRISEISSFDLYSWQDTLLVERLERKSNEILKLLNSKTNDWEEIFYILMLRNFGLKTNSEPFEILSRSLPLKYILKHKENLLSIESMLFGVAGFLEDNIDDEYYRELQKEYSFIKNKFNLKQIELSTWKFMRIRPASFPTIRIAQIATLLFKNNNIFSKIIEYEKIDKIFHIFDVETSEYWKTHYKFGSISQTRNKKIGIQSMELLIINVIVPILFTYGNERKIDKHKERAINILNEIKAEKNSIIKYWNNLNVKTKSSFETQSMLELYNEYCLKNKCLNCRIAKSLIKK